jgi:hypothetical protein
MADIKNRMIANSESKHSIAPMANAFIAGQNGPVTDLSTVALNTSYTSRNVVCKILEFPEWVESMPEPEYWKRAIKTFFETHTQIDGLNKALTAEFAETLIGGGGQRQFELTDVKEEQSDITHTGPDSYNLGYQNMLSAWIRYGMMDPIAKVPLASVIDDSVTEQLLSFYSMTALYYEMDPLQKYPLRAWICTNMAPRLNGPDGARRQLDAPGEKNELAIQMTSLQQTGFGALQAAKQEIDRHNRLGLNTFTRQAFITEPDPDVEATKVGYNATAEQAANSQI